MGSHSPEHQGRINHPTVSRRTTNPVFEFADKRPGAILQKKLQTLAHQSPQSQKLQAVQKMADHSSLKTPALQLQPVIQREVINSETFGKAVTGERELVEVFDELMGNRVFSREIHAYLVENHFLSLNLFGDHSRFVANKQEIRLNEALSGDKEKIRQELAFELHNVSMTASRGQLWADNAIPLGRKSNPQKIKQARITEFTEWVNIMKLGARLEEGRGGRMGFLSEPGLVRDLKTHFLNFESYLLHQLKTGHTQNYLEGAVSEVAGQTLDLTSRDPQHYKTRTPSLFASFEGEPEFLATVLGQMQMDSEIRQKINWARDARTTRIKEASNLRGEDKTSIRAMHPGEVIRVLNKNKAGNYFSTASFLWWRKNHYWVQTSRGEEGWVTDDAVED